MIKVNYEPEKSNPVRLSFFPFPGTWRTNVWLVSNRDSMKRLIVDPDVKSPMCPVITWKVCK